MEASKRLYTERSVLTIGASKDLDLHTQFNPGLVIISGKGNCVSTESKVVIYAELRSADRPSRTILLSLPEVAKTPIRS